MTLSTGPWWWAPVFASGSMTTVPAHSFSAPACAVVIAAARLIPGVCGVLGSSSPARTMRTPSRRQSRPSEGPGIAVRTYRLYLTARSALNPCDGRRAQLPFAHVLSRHPPAAAARDAGAAGPRPRDAAQRGRHGPAAVRAGRRCAPHADLLA